MTVKRIQRYSQMLTGSFMNMALKILIILHRHIVTAAMRPDNWLRPVPAIKFKLERLITDVKIEK